MNGLGILMPPAGSTQTSFKEDQSQRRAFAAVRMRKHRYSGLAERDEQSDSSSHSEAVVAAPVPLRSKFRGPGRTSIWNHIGSQLTKINVRSRTGEYGEDCSVDDEIIMKLFMILMWICDSTSVYPHISIDGDSGIAAVWYADELSLEILVDSDGCAEAIVKSGNEMRSIDLVEGDFAALRMVRGHLGRLTAHVKARNPLWRNLVV
ncbi:hypothetical protein VSH64_34470 [Amycolatopsis rhabdoformis]|uniref:Uncharacterized protein n=1 Tax=Amycolatopsis rhabdoformis TaxID=1448059 RepID=A0ABZ1I198_9PSEU|nr:hypothetical protein [Amycolatopsis rhabdoformis]WSE27924.1 hypothetical protein VSH64_34470 [Amycolatopsis rhabdoformis]